MIPSKLGNKKRILIFLFFCTICFLTYYHNVPKNLTIDDKKALNDFWFGQKHLDSTAFLHHSFETDTTLLRKVQRILISSFPHTEPIPLGQSREPKNLIEAGGGFCYDRARFLEKTFLYLGFEVRRVFLFSLENNANSSMYSLFLKKNATSHAILEVKTQKGWMVVGTNMPFMGLDKNGKVYSMDKLESYYSSNPKYSIQWVDNVEDAYNYFYNEPCKHTYGLLSRHGQFYPPFNFIPDYNISDMKYNFFFED